MADYRLSANIIKRSSGRSSVAASAYRAGLELHDERTGLAHDYTRKRGVLHSEILAPDNAPEWMTNRAKLWNAVEAAERRKDAQLSREIQLSLPHELDEDQNRALVLDFIRSEFVSRGMVADVAIHAPDRQGDERNIHAHVMLSTRVLTGAGFGKKNRQWNAPEQLQTWREQWAGRQNQEFERLGLEIRVDHRSYAQQGIDREPTQHLGPVANDMERKGEPSRIGNENRERMQRNTQRAARAQDSAALSRQLAAEKARSAEHSNVKRAELEGGLQHDFLELDRRHDRARHRLEAEQRERNGHLKTAMEQQARQLDNQLRATGWLKLMRDFIGKTEQDRQNREALARNMADLASREAEEMAALTNQQQLEKTQFEQQRQTRQQAYERRLQQEREQRLGHVRDKAERDQARKPAPANDPQPPAWHRTAAPEQQNAPIARKFDKAATASPQRQPGALTEEQRKAAELEKYKEEFRKAFGGGGRDPGGGPDRGR